MVHSLMHRTWTDELLPVTAEWAHFLRADPEMWAAARHRARSGPKVLMATSSGGYNIVTVMESLIAAALTMRGASVSFLMCDQALPACIRANFQSIDDQELSQHGLSRRLCASCWTEGSATVGGLGLPLLRQSEMVTEAEKAQAARIATQIEGESIGRYVYDGLPIGEHALAGALRYYARGDLAGEPHGERILRRYFEAALLSMFAMRRALRDLGFQKAVCNHGIYVPFGIFAAVACQEQREFINWCVSYRRLTFLFSHGDTYHHTLMTEPASVWENMDWSAEKDREIEAYLKSRWQGTRDWVYFHERPEQDADIIVRKLGVDMHKPIIGMLTNVVWDAQLHYPANAFPGIVEWLVETVRYFQRHPELQLVIRVHPAEARGTIPSRQRAVDELQRHFPELPPNVFVIPPESRISTYAVMELCNAALIYGTKMGVELTSVGLPVIVAGEAWIRNKGLTMDARSVEEYRSLLDRLPLAGPLEAHTRQRARKYAYHFFFRRMIPVHRVLVEAKGPALLRVTARTARELDAGFDPGLDTICGGILENRPFIYDGPVGEPGLSSPGQR